MRTVLKFCLYLWLAASAPAFADQPKTLTVWIMPFEDTIHDKSGLLGVTHDVVTGESRRRGAPDTRRQYEVSVTRFNEEVQQLTAGRVVVLNTTDDVLKQQLLTPHPDYKQQTLQTIASQGQTLRVLARIAATCDVRIRVLFVSWKTALSDLLHPRQTVAPDIAEVGSTWVETMASHDFGNRRLAIPEDVDRDRQPGAGIKYLNWRVSSVSNVPVSLKLSTDVRLLFYWKQRSPDHEDDTDVNDSPDNGVDKDGLLALNTDSWKTAIDALREHIAKTGPEAYPMVFPAQSDTDLLHMYLMLAHGTSGKLLDGPRAVFASPAAKEIPHFLSRNVYVSGQREKRLLSFPLINSREATDRFFDNDYVAMLHNTSLLRRWHRSFTKRWPEEDFWDYAGVAIPPAKSFLGGSDVLVFRGDEYPVNAFQVAKFIVTDRDLMALKARNGYFSAQRFTSATDSNPTVDPRIQPLLEELGIDLQADLSNHGVRDYVAHVTTLLEDAERPTPRYLVEHAAIPEFATDVESPDVLYAMQRIWLAIAEGDVRQLDLATRQAVLEINGRINTTTKLYNVVRDHWIYLVVLAFAIAGTLGASFWQTRRKHNLAYIAIESFKHRNHVMISRAGKYMSDASRKPPAELSRRSDQLAELWREIRSLEDDLQAELSHEFRAFLSESTSAIRRLFRAGSDSGPSAPSLRDTVQRAWDLAWKQYEFAEEPGPTISFDVQGLDDLTLRHFPHQLTAILHDWLYNCCKHATDGCICVTGDGSSGRLQLRIRSPSQFSASVQRELQAGTSKCERARAVNSPYVTFSDQCRAVFGTRPKCILVQEPRHEVELLVVLPVRRLRGEKQQRSCAGDHA